jgi:hypothetical protein
VEEDEMATTFHTLCAAVEAEIGAYLSQAVDDRADLGDLAANIDAASGGVACCVVADGMLRIHVVMFSPM